MITGGFGMTMDLERGTMRQWVMGRDGVKRWADTGDPVTEQRVCKCGIPWEPDMDQFGCWSCGAERPVPNAALDRTHKA